MKKQSTNLLVGAKIVIDYPNRWQGAKDPAIQARLRAEVETSKNDPSGRGAYFFGENGTIVNYRPNDEKGEMYDVLRDLTGEVISIHQCEFTVQLLPPNKDQEIINAIVSLTTAITGGNKLTLGLLKQLVKQLEDLSVKPL